MLCGKRDGALIPPCQPPPHAHKQPLLVRESAAPRLPSSRDWCQPERGGVLPGDPQNDTAPAGKSQATLSDPEREITGSPPPPVGCPFLRRLFPPDCRSKGGRLRRATAPAA